ncbi:MAG: type II CAAX endopeptidase family protein [Hyphomonadaceae bacterium]|nr:type II CAAX endopeptidase family protein [Hyphomonadaceae bacterium]
MFPVLPLASLTGFDVAAVVLLSVVVPLYGWIGHGRDKRREAEGQAKALAAQYREALIFLWGATAVVLAIWMGASRPLAGLGLDAPFSLTFWGAMGFAVLASAAYASQIVMLRRSAKARAQLVKQLAGQAGVKAMLPTTRREMGWFRVVALSAGVGEEIVFRGFLIWAFAHWMPIWAAAGCALVVFTLSHLYQENVRALAGVAVAGAVMTALVMVSGSLFPAMLLHTVIDLAGGEMTWLARREEEPGSA